MSSLRNLRLDLVLVVAVGTLASPPDAHARRMADVTSLPAATMTAGGLDTPELRLVLPDGRTVAAHRRHLELVGASMTWLGNIADDTTSRVVVTSHRSVVAGTAVVDGHTFELRPQTGTASTLVAYVEPDTTPLEPDVFPRDGRVPTGASKPAATAMSAALVPVVQDLLVLYTAASVRHYGVATLESRILGGVAAANQAYRDSGVGITLRLVGLQQAESISEAPSGMVETLARLRNSVEATAARERTAADMVLLVNESTDWCGYAYIMYAPTRAYQNHAFAAVRAGCLSQEVIAHELGHVQGLMHDRATMPDAGALPYGHGYRVCERGGFRDVMSYPCPKVDVPRVRLFSNPDLLYQGVPTGIAHETDPAHSADAARALNETAALVAAYRESADHATPGTPAALTATSRRGVAHLQWRGAVAGSTIVIERTTTGVFEEIARIGPGSAAFADRTVQRGHTYSYRLRALGSGGYSEASNVATVTIGRASTRGALRPFDWASPPLSQRPRASIAR